ncbi:hypothetical protein KC19_6G025000 [Ceratodon purpureus]|uniref:Uncharacterized protein n=1 Tax=Ceratodon purpureus TaxID=3225 RepID=A0A8T0H9C4_CERPU|nr:hypothetical protein KC19_6G025000 [Ceratodon purpureus]
MSICAREVCRRVRFRGRLQQVVDVLVSLVFLICFPSASRASFGLWDEDEIRG